ncbi:MAG: hypothetical protein ABJA76_01710 [Mucilaginibacter sp.]
MKHLAGLLLCCLSVNAFAQNHEAGATHNVKSRCYVTTIYGPGTATHTDTSNCQIFNPAQKSIIYNAYSQNKVRDTYISEYDAKGVETSSTQKTGETVSSRDDYFRDTGGHIIRIVKHYFAKAADGSIRESTDTTNLVYDKAGNKISTATPHLGRMTWAYDKANRLVERDSYTLRNDKPQRDVTTYQGNLPLETLSYWYDGRLYHRLTNTYNDKQQLTDLRDSTTSFFETKHYIYNKTGLKAIEVVEKTFRDKSSKTTIEYTYDVQNRLLTQTFHSNDRSLLVLYPLSYRAKQPDYELKETYTYDKYGNRLQIQSDLDGEKVRVISFLMTYY